LKSCELATDSYHFRIERELAMSTRFLRELKGESEQWRRRMKVGRGDKIYLLVYQVKRGGCKSFAHWQQQHFKSLGK